MCHGGCIGVDGRRHHHVHAYHCAVFGHIHVLRAQQSLHGFPALHGGIHHHAGIGIVGHKLAVEAIYPGVVRTLVVVFGTAGAVDVHHQFDGSLLFVEELFGEIAERFNHVHVLLVRHIHADDSLLHVILVIYGDGGTRVVIAFSGKVFLVEPQFALGSHQCAIGIGTQCRGGGQGGCRLLACGQGGQGVPCLEGRRGSRGCEHSGLLGLVAVYHGQARGCSSVL